MIGEAFSEYLRAAQTAPAAADAGDFLAWWLGTQQGGGGGGDEDGEQCWVQY